MSELCGQRPEICSSWEGAETISLSPVRDFPDGNADLGNALAQNAPRLGAWLKDLREGIPLPKTVKPFTEGPFFRPPGSYRSFYYCPAPAGDGGRPVIAIKGLEPCTGDFDALAEEFRKACYSPHNIAEHMVFEEHKIPGCLSLAEAIKEGERAAAIQLAHLRTYGGLARLPVPLLVVRHSDQAVGKATATLSRVLSTTACEAIEPMLRAGLGGYIYYYPGTPVRVRDLDFELAGLDFRARTLRLLTACDPEGVVRRWVSGFVRMLYLGFLPGSLASFRTGACCQPQNACLDGGFVDLDSITPIHELRDDTAVYAALQFSFESMLRTIRVFLVGSTVPVRAESTDIRVDLHYFTQHLIAALDEAVKAEARPGIELDRRIAKYFTPAQSVADLVERLSTYHSPRAGFDGYGEEVRGSGPGVQAASRGES